MSNAPSARDAARLLTQLHKARPGHHSDVATAEASPEMRVLQQWQAERLATTHSDLLVHPRYKPATELFLNDVYGPQDFSQRNHDMERFYEGVARVLPKQAVSVLANVVELNTLTNELDNQLLDVLVGNLNMTDSLSAEQYAEAYQICDNYEDRLRQIEMITIIGQDIDRLVHTRFVGTTLRLAHTPAVLAGWSELQGFLERGFKAFKHMKGADEFLALVNARETAILDRIFAEDSQPFVLTHAKLH